MKFELQGCRPNSGPRPASAKQCIHGRPGFSGMKLKGAESPRRIEPTPPFGHPSMEAVPTPACGHPSMEGIVIAGYR